MRKVLLFLSLFALPVMGEATEKDCRIHLDARLNPEDIYWIGGVPFLKIDGEYYQIEIMTADEFLKRGE